MRAPVPCEVRVGAEAPRGALRGRIEGDPEGIEPFEFHPSRAPPDGESAPPALLATVRLDGGAATVVVLPAWPRGAPAPPVPWTLARAAPDPVPEPMELAGDAAPAAGAARGPWLARVKRRGDGPAFYGRVAEWIPASELGGALGRLALSVPEYARDAAAPERIRYFGALDVDAAWAPDRKARLRWWLDAVAGAGATVDHACRAFDELAAARAAAEAAAAEAVRAGATHPLVFFTGFKGFRVLFHHPRAYRRVRVDQSFGAAALERVVAALAGAAGAAAADASTYDCEKGLKTDVYPHPETGIWPTRGALGAGADPDPGLRGLLRDHWERVVAGLDGAERAAAPLEGPPRRVPAAARGAAGPAGAAAVSKEKTPPACANIAFDDAVKAGGGVCRTHWIALPKGPYHFHCDAAVVNGKVKRHLAAGRPVYVHEVIDAASTRFFIDLDAKEGDAPWDRTSVARTAMGVLAARYAPEDCRAIVLATAGRASAHLVWPRIVHPIDAVRRIARAVRAALPADEARRMDLGVYAKGKSLRMPGASKRAKAAERNWTPAGGQLVPVAELLADGTVLPAPGLARAVDEAGLRPTAAWPAPLPVHPDFAPPAPRARRPAPSAAEAAAEAAAAEGGRYDADYAEDAARAFLRRCPAYEGAAETIEALEPCVERQQRGLADTWVVKVPGLLFCAVGRREHREAGRVEILVSEATGEARAYCWSETCRERNGGSRTAWHTPRSALFGAS